MPGPSSANQISTFWPRHPTSYFGHSSWPVAVLLYTSVCCLSRHWSLLGGSHGAASTPPASCFYFPIWVVDQVAVITHLKLSRFLSKSVACKKLMISCLCCQTFVAGQSLANGLIVRALSGIE